MIERKKAEIKDLLSKANEKELPEDMFHPLDNTDYNWQEQEKDGCSLGLKFVPTIRRHNLAKKFKDLLQFGRRLRLAVFFHRVEKEQELVENQIVREVSEEIEYEEPWRKPSTFNPKQGQNEALGSFLLELEDYLFDPKKNRKVKHNLTQIQRNALRSLSTWNVSPNCDRMFRIQDKGSRLVIEWKDQYRRKTLHYLEDISIFKEELENPSERNKGKVNEWARKWNLRKNIGEEEYEWITQSGLRPGKTYANIKTHKGGWPYRFIISSIGTPIDNLARWIEFPPKALI